MTPKVIAGEHRPDAGDASGRLVRWWRNRTLRGRLSLLVAGAVAVAVIAVAVLAWAAVGEVMRQQVHSQLETDASAIAAQPAQWIASAAAQPDLPDHDDRGGGNGGGRGGGHDLGPRWQILDAAGGAIGESAGPLPVTDGARRVAAGTARRVQERVTVSGAVFQMLTVRASGGGAVQVAVNQDPDNRTLNTLALLLAVGCVLGVVAAALLGRFVARAGLVPVQRLTEAVEEVAVTQDLTRPIPVIVTGVDEVARLGRSVNSMLAALETSRRAQRALVEDAGHELRTPLTSIRTNIELLIEVDTHPEFAHRLLPGDRARLLRDLNVQVGELTTLTAELVELGREDSSREEAEPTELVDVVTAAINRVRARAPGLTFGADLRPVTVFGRPGELERMVLNVLDNAAKWSPPGGTVTTTLDGDGSGGVRLIVTDEGPGIEDVDRPHVFDRFYRAATARSMPGSGLGLAIVAQTAMQHGGTVSVGSNAPRGTAVTITLPWPKGA